MQIGIVEYSNSLPFIAPYLLKSLPSPFSWILGHPEELNRKTLAKELPISFVSSLFYLKHKDELELIPGIGIGADGPVESVCLYYPEKLFTFTNVTVALHPESATSNGVLKWYLEKIRGHRPYFVASPTPENHPAFLLIGDKCLSFKTPKGFKKIDLAEEWKSFTNLPLPFAVLVADKHFARNNRQEIHLAKETLLNGVKWSLENLSLAATLSSFPQERLIAYWQKLRYHFDARYTTALVHMERDVLKRTEAHGIR